MVSKIKEPSAINNSPFLLKVITIKAQRLNLFNNYFNFFFTFFTFYH
nr:MAG TPA: hypothetical protein [Caudoviricetes sp.]